MAAFVEFKLFIVSTLAEFRKELSDRHSGTGSATSASGWRTKRYVVSGIIFQARNPAKATFPFYNVSS
jgi:hypothetical protein